MKLAIGLYRHQLDCEHYRFARQCGCTHLVIHLVDYFKSSQNNRPGDQPLGDDSGWGLAGDPDKLWTVEVNPSPNNQFELCVGTLAETTEGNFHEAVESYAAQNRIGYMHLRNVRGTAPNYRETFIDEGDVDVFRILRSLHKHNYQGVLIPDHAPQMTCDAPWHAGMAFALGYLKAAIQTITESTP
jgi:hypothetical protein